MRRSVATSETAAIIVTMRRSLVGLGLFIVAACGTVKHDDSATKPLLGTSKQDLSSYNDEVNPKFMGDDLGDHELALTFDDGPGTMEVTGALAQWLHDHKNPKTGAPQPIQATFFVLGSCIKRTSLSNDEDKNNGCPDPTPNATAVLDKLVSLGHYIGNHTTTHRVLPDIVAGDEPGDVVKELTETDGLISKYLVWNRMFFRAPTGGWNATVFNQLKGTAMNKYAGPIYWNAGGGAGEPPVSTTQAADWACWNGPNGDGTGKRYTTHQCGDRYIKEIRDLDDRGIVLMHDPYGANFGNLDAVPGNTLDMVKYVIGELEKDAKPWTFKRLDEVPAIAAVLPKCDASCVQCSGPEATKCTECAADKHLDAGKCVAGAPIPDAGTDADGGSSSGDPTGTSSSSSSTSSSGGTSGPSSSGSSNPSGDDAGGGDAAAPADDGGGCNTSGSDFGTSLGAAAIALGLVISRRSKRRRA